MVYHEGKQVVTDTINHCIAEKKLFELKHRIICNSGNLKWVLTQSEIYFDEKGIPIQIISLFIEKLFL